MRTNNPGYTKFTNCRAAPNSKTPTESTGFGVPVFNENSLPAAAISKEGDLVYARDTKQLMIFDGVEWEVSYPDAPPAPPQGLAFAAMQSNANGADTAYVAGVSQLAATGVIADTLVPVGITRSNARLTNTNGLTTTMILNAYVTLTKSVGGGSSISLFFVKNGSPVFFLGNATIQYISSNATATTMFVSSIVTLDNADYVEVWMSSSLNNTLTVNNFTYSMSSIPAAYAGFQQAQAFSMMNVARATLLPFQIGGMSLLPYAGGLTPQDLGPLKVLRNTSGKQMTVSATTTVSVSSPAISAGMYVTIDYLINGGDANLSGDVASTPVMSLNNAIYSATLTKMVVLEAGEYLSVGFVLQAGAADPQIDVRGFTITSIQSN